MEARERVPLDLERIDELDRALIDKGRTLPNTDRAIVAGIRYLGVCIVYAGEQVAAAIREASA